MILLHCLVRLRLPAALCLIRSGILVLALALGLLLEVLQLLTVLCLIRTPLLRLLLLRSVSTPRTVRLPPITPPQVLVPSRPFPPLPLPPFPPPPRLHP